MEYKVKSVLLIDDDKECLFLHKYALRESKYIEHIEVAMNGEEALEFIRETIAANGSLPEIVFVDINMPVMDGWEFMEEFDALPVHVKSKMNVVMLSTSVNPDDELRATTNSNVWRYCQKNLTSHQVTELVAALYVTGCRI